MIKSFKKFSEESIKTLVTTFGRFNPPTIGHKKLFDKVVDVAGGEDYQIYASHSEDPKKNPLAYEDKIKFLRKMFPEYARNIILDPDVKNVFHVASKAHGAGYNRFILVVGSDRVKEFETTLKKYQGVKGSHGFYDFKYGVEIKSAGERDPDSDDVEGMSASKMRAAAAANDLQTFSSGLPSGFKGAKALLNAVRKGMGLKESSGFRKHIELATSDVREMYLSGEILKVGDIALCKKTSAELEILERYNNYVSARCLSTDGIKKYFPGDLIPSEQ
jgi:hypothetical protein